MQVSDLTEATIPQQLAAPIASLRRHGWRLVNNGVGKFGAVMRKPGNDFVLKLFQADDLAYYAFVELAKAHPNPHFPRFIRDIIPVTRACSVVRVEPLTANHSAQTFKFCHLTGLYMETIDETADSFGWRSVQEARAWVAAQSPDLKQACDLIATKLLNRFNLDLEARNNVMMRGNTFVFSDPVAVALE